MRTRGGIALAVALGGCASAPPPGLRTEAPPPPYQKIIAENLDVMFAQDAKMRSVSISGIRRGGTPAGLQWRVCLRGTANNVTGGPGAHTYVVFMDDRGQITDRRLARREDGCDQERYERLARA